MMKTIKVVGVILYIALGTVSISSASVDKNLKYGQRDKEVSELQEFLIDKGFLNTVPSSFFGLLTLKAVKLYQTSIGVTSTGYVGILTRQKINDELSAELASSTQAELQETGTTTVTTYTKTSNSAVITPTVAPTTNTATYAPVTQTQQPQVIFVQIPTPVVSTPPTTSIAQTEKLYTITKSGSVIKDSINEQAVRDFMSDLTDYASVKKYASTYPLFPVSEGDQKNISSFLKANDYMLTEK